VKNSLIALAAALVLVSTTGRLHAQAPTGTRVGIVNVGLVFSKYNKAIFYKTELENTLKPYKKKGEELNEQVKKYGPPLQEGKITDPALKEQYTKYLLQLKREMEDLDASARKLVGKKQEDQIVALYKEVIGEIQDYAKQNRFDLILGYGQKVEGDLYTIENITRIMQGMDQGSTTPLALGIGVDISQAVIDSLNRRYQGSVPSAPVAPVTPASLKKQ